MTALTTAIAAVEASVTDNTNNITALATVCVALKTANDVNAKQIASLTAAVAVSQNASPPAGAA